MKIYTRDRKSRFAFAMLGDKMHWESGFMFICRKLKEHHENKNEYWMNKGIAFRLCIVNTMKNTAYIYDDIEECVDVHDFVDASYYYKKRMSWNNSSMWYHPKVYEE